MVRLQQESPRLSLPRRFLTLSTAVIAAILSHTPASAQDDDSKRPLFHARFGWDEKAVPNCWNPIKITVTGGTEPFQGALAVNYQQDASQSARVIVPVTVMPGQEIPIEALGYLAPRPEKISVSLLNARGQNLDTINYTQFPRRGNERQLKDTLDEREGLILAIGSTSITTAAKSWRPEGWGLIPFPDDFEDSMYQGNRSKVSFDEIRQKAWQRLTVASARPQDLSTSWAAYEPAVAVVVHASDAQFIDPRALAALHKWVQSGGRLVIIADEPGPYWQAWLGDENPVELFAQAQTLAGPELAAIHPSQPESEEEEGSDADETPSGTLEDTLPVTSADVAVTGRSMRLTDQAIQNGWSLHWRTDPTNPQTTGLMAQGPIGFGWLTLMGIEPRRVPASLSNDSTAAVWKDALEIGLRDWLDRTSREMEVHEASYYISYEPEWRRAELEALGSFSDFNIAGAGVFILIVIGVAVLGLMLGPVDGIVLKRLHISQRSWLTALAWIGIASVLAYIGPRMLRTDGTSVNRIEVIDLLPNESATIAWQTGLTGIFASSSGATQLQNVDQYAYWRGLSATRPNFWERNQIALPTITSFQANAQAGQERPGNPINDLSLAMWTFRALTDNGPAQPPIRSSIQRDRQEVRITINGLSDPQSIEFAAVQFSDGWLRIKKPSDAFGPSQETEGAQVDDAILVTTVETRLLKATKPSELDTLDKGDHQNPVYGYGELPPFKAGTGFSLPAPASRSLAIERRVQSGNYAALYLRLSPSEPPITINHTKPEYNTDQIFRILIPLTNQDDSQTEPSP